MGDGQASKQVNWFSDPKSGSHPVRSWDSQRLESELCPASSLRADQNSESPRLR